MIDDIDRKILHEVQLNNQQTSAELSDRIGLSATSIQRRLNRLRADKIIESDVSIVSNHSVGRPMILMIAVQLERERSDIIDRFKKSVRNAPEVMSAYYVTGESDFILIVSAKNMEDYEEFTRKFFYDNLDIKGFKTTVVMDQIKASFFVPTYKE